VRLPEFFAGRVYHEGVYPEREGDRIGGAVFEVSQSQRMTLRGLDQGVDFRCAGRVSDFTGSFQGREYRRSEIGEAVYQLKYQGQEEQAKIIADRMAAFLETHPAFAHVAALIPVPPTIRGRRCDPVATIVAAVSQVTDVPCIPLLYRQVARQPQKSLQTLAAKTENARGAFAVTDPENARGQRLLLVDDFYDSGATLAECTRVLRACSPKFIGVLTAGKTVHHA